MWGVVELIHPARFLFNAGSTPAEWNKKMLRDEHLKVLFYEPISANVFPDTDIKGGIAITYRNEDKSFGAIETFSAYPVMNRVIKKVKHCEKFVGLNEIILSRTAYRLTKLMHEEHPDALEKLSKGHAFDMSSNIFKDCRKSFLI